MKSWSGLDKGLKRYARTFFLLSTWLTLAMMPVTHAQEASTAATAAATPSVDATESAAAEDASDNQMDFELEEKKEASPEEVFNLPISLDLRNIDVLEALKFISTKAGLNIVTSKSVSGRVTLTLDKVILRDVFDLVLRSNGLAYAKQGDIYNVMTEAEYKTLYGVNFSDLRQVKVFRLKYAIPDQAFSLLDALKSEIGRVLVDAESGNVLIMDTPEKIEEMQKALEEFEKANTVQVFALDYAKAKEVEDILKLQLDAKKVGYIKADERNNQVIVQTLPERMREISRLIKVLDKQTKEVIIDTKIIKIKLSDQSDTGIEWEGLFQLPGDHGMSYAGSYPFSVVESTTAAATATGWQSRYKFLNDAQLGGGVGAYPFSGTSTDFAASSKVSPGEKMHLGIVDSSRDVDLVFKYLKTLGQTKVLSNPKLVVVNNQEAKIHIGEKQAYVTTTTTAGQSTSTIAEEVTFVDVGIQLSVTPNINDDGYITMKVKPEISSVSSVLTTPTNNKIPIIDTSLTETTVMMKDGTTLIIGGLRKEEKMSSSEQLPIFGNIPFLGNFFKSSTTKTERTELVVMMTPHIISGKEFATGDSREFGHIPGKDYRPYQGIVPDAEGTRPEIEPKPYRDYPRS